MLIAVIGHSSENGNSYYHCEIFNAKWSF